jgi:hypothetical protein
VLFDETPAVGLGAVKVNLDRNGPLRDPLPPLVGELVRHESLPTRAMDHLGKVSASRVIDPAVSALVYPRDQSPVFLTDDAANHSRSPGDSRRCASLARSDAEDAA